MKPTETKIVTGCGVNLEYDEMIYKVSAAKEIGCGLYETSFSFAITPPNCPLREKDLTIKLQTP